MRWLPAASYARVASDHQAAAPTLASPGAALRERVALDGLVLPAPMQFLEAGYRGATGVRPALARRRDGSAAGASDRL